MWRGNRKAASGRWDGARDRTKLASGRRRRRPGCESLESRHLLATIAEYSLPSGVLSRPTVIVDGPDGDLWFTEPGIDKIGKINPTTHAVSEITLPLGMSAYSITASIDGNLWFTPTTGGEIGRLNPATGVVTLFKVPSLGASPAGITSDTAGDLWFADSGTGRIGLLYPATGTITEFPISIGQLNLSPMPFSIAPDSLGNVWFTDPITGMIGEANAVTGAVEIPLKGTTNPTPGGITQGPDGRMWFTVNSLLTGNAIGVLDPVTLAISLFSIPSRDYTTDITAGPDGNLWFTE